MRQATVATARSISPSVRELTIDAGSDFTFKPGQWVSFKIPLGNGSSIPRSYSIASGPRADGRFEIAVTRVHEGPGSTYMHEARVGETLPMTEAQGYFTMPSMARPVLMVATGTGVSPFRAMLQALGPGKLAHPVVLLFGARTEADILFGEEFEQRASMLEGFKFVATLSQGSSEWKGSRGYVQVHVPELVTKLGECDVYICGLSKMVKDVRRILKAELAVDKSRVHSERYD